MGFTQVQIEAQIQNRIAAGETRQEAIDSLMAAASKGAARAEKEVILAKDALTRATAAADIKRHTDTVSREGRLASLENHTVAVLKQIIAGETASQ